MRLNLLTGGSLIGSCLVFFSLSFASEDLDQKDIWQDTVWHQWRQSKPDWLEPITPSRIIGNIHYVGTQGIGAYLIVSDQGHIALDGGLPQNAQQVSANIVSLGFDLSAVKYPINSHAHFDHSGGLSELKALTGARLIASKLDSTWLENGRYPDSDNPSYNSVPVVVDRIIRDGENLKLGENTLTAHSPGCTSWQSDALEGQVSYRVIFFCGVPVAANRLFPEPQYQGIIQDYEATFATIKDWEIDVYLSNHPFYFNLNKKRAAQLDGGSLAFVIQRRSRLRQRPCRMILQLS
jgi:metallo-beta-lactamase class B